MTSVVAFILARGGSKGLPGKNIHPFAGKPLISWTIDASLICSSVDRTIVSTDCPNIAKIVQQTPAELMIRPEELATDTAMPKDAIRYHLEQIQAESGLPDITVLLQPTSPLRGSDVISQCIQNVLSGNSDSCATFQRSPSSPYRAWVESYEGPRAFVEGYNPWQPRQNLPATYALNGAAYAMRTDLFLKDPTHSFLPGRSSMVVMSAEESIDIDTALDLKIAETIFTETKNSTKK